MRAGAFRKYTGCTQEWMSQQLGVSMAYITMIEAGKRKKSKRLRDHYLVLNTWARNVKKLSSQVEFVLPDSVPWNDIQNRIMLLEYDLTEAKLQLGRMEKLYKETVACLHFIEVLLANKPPQIIFSYEALPRTLSSRHIRNLNSCNRENQINLKVKIAKLEAELNVLRSLSEDDWKMISTNNVQAMGESQVVGDAG